MTTIFREGRSPKEKNVLLLLLVLRSAIYIYIYIYIYNTKLEKYQIPSYNYKYFNELNKFSREGFWSRNALK